MERRPESRVEADIPVRVWGMDASGKPFFESALAANLSSGGAELSHLHHGLKIGDIIGIQYGEKKARFEVIWAKNSVTPGRNQAGVKILARQSIPWAQIATPEKAPEAKASSARDRRRFERHKVQFPLDISFPNTQRTHMRCNATDVSGHGCYVELLVPLPLSSELEIIFWIDSEKIRTRAVVRASDPGVGMGIEFTSLDPSTEARLQQHMEKLDKGFARAASETR